MKSFSNSEISKLINIDKAMGDILDILSALDGRVRRVELKTQITKRRSYLKPVEENCDTCNKVDRNLANNPFEVVFAEITDLHQRLVVLEQK